VFWNRAAREARRQKVLDELIELAPEDRQQRMNQAVAEGDVRAGEVEQALRLVGRLEALRIMTIPGHGSAAPAGANQPEPEPEVQSEPTAATGTASDPAPRRKPTARFDGGARRSRKPRRRVAVEISRKLEELAAVQTAPRATLTRDAAVRRAGRAIGGSPRRRRLRQAAAPCGERVSAPAVAAVLDRELVASAASMAMVVVSQPVADEQWPSIDWLRPE
jgi:hypothetical protein